MLFLLPPSETKAVGGGNLTIQQAALTFGGLNPARDQVLAALLKLCKKPKEAAKVLKLTPKQLGAIDVNLAVPTAPTMPAIQRYTGTLYDAKIWMNNPLEHRGYTLFQSSYQQLRGRLDFDGLFAASFRNRPVVRAWTGFSDQPTYDVAAEIGATLIETFLDEDGVDEVHIDKDVVEGRKEPVRVYAKKDKTAATSGDAA